jgi:hypothetical protein
MARSAHMKRVPMANLFVVSYPSNRRYFAPRLPIVDRIRDRLKEICIIEGCGLETSVVPPLVNHSIESEQMFGVEQRYNGVSVRFADRTAQVAGMQNVVGDIDRR